MDINMDRQKNRRKPLVVAQGVKKESPDYDSNGSGEGGGSCGYLKILGRTSWSKTMEQKGFFLSVS